MSCERDAFTHTYTRHLFVLIRIMTSIYGSRSLFPPPASFQGHFLSHPTGPFPFLIPGGIDVFLSHRVWACFLEFCLQLRHGGTAEQKRTKWENYFLLPRFTRSLLPHSNTDTFQCDLTRWMWSLFHDFGENFENIVPTDYRKTALDFKIRSFFSKTPSEKFEETFGTS